MTRLEKLKALEETLEEQMERANSRSIAAIARQYRETLREIAEIEGTEEADDEIAEILQERESNGKARSVR